MVERAQAANMLYDAHKSVIDKHTDTHAWVCTGTIRADGALLLDHMPGLALLHYAVLDPLTLPLADMALARTGASLATFTGGADNHVHPFSLPVQFNPPQPGDRVAVLQFRTGDGGDGPLIEAWVIGRLRVMTIAPGGAV